MRSRRFAIALSLVLLSAPRALAADALVPDAFGRVGEGTITPPGAPRLVVVLLFDQFRDDFLDRFREHFVAGGFRRVEREGTRFTDCNIPFAQTLTAPDHATLLTGATPSVHGIVGNGWYEVAEGRDVSADFDPRERAVGSDDQESSSPRRLRAQTVGDVLRGATRGRGKVIGISDKARAAILPAGHHANAAYWLDDKTARMQSSTYYMSRLPAWAVAANAGRRPEEARVTWTPLLPASAYAACVVGRGAPTFPHVVDKDGTIEGANAVAATPFAVTNLFAFARQAIEGEELGADGVPDLLTLSVSAPDRVGHLFGPDSPEAMDIAVRCDREVASFLAYLDRRVGRGRYLVAVTSDHGCATTESFARRFEAVSADSVGAIADTSLVEWADGVLDRAMKPRRRVKQWIRAVGEGALWLDRDSLARAGVTVAAASRTLADSATTWPWLAAGFSGAELAAGLLDRPYAGAVARGYFPGRSGDVVFLARPFAYFGWGAHLRGDHGSPYRYDTHVPLVFFGAGVAHGVRREPVSTVDIAPTVAALIGIEPPAQSEGHALLEPPPTLRP